MSSLLLFVFILIILSIFTASMCLGHSSTRLGRTSQENCKHNRVTGRQLLYCASRWMAGLHSGNVWCSHYNTARGAQMRLGLNDCRRQRGNMTLPLLNKATLQSAAFLTAKIFFSAIKKLDTSLLFLMLRITQITEKIGNNANNRK